MIYAAKLYKQAISAEKFGVTIKGAKLDFNKVLEYTDNLVQDAIQDNDRQLAQFDIIDLIRKKGHCVSESSVEIILY